MELKPTDEYKRSELHDAFGGQRQGGISTPEHRILLFSGKVGENFGYTDGWENKETFLYTGEGQIGDMTFVRGNRAVRDHVSSNRPISLFTTTRRSYVKYEGDFEYLDYQVIRTRDREGNARDAIQFILERSEPKKDSKVSAKELLKPRLRPPNATERRGLVTSRVGQGHYRNLLLEKFESKCAVSGLAITEILIASHIIPWRNASDLDRLNPENGLLLSPTYDALFDRQLISFDDDGSILISTLLEHDQRQSLGLSGCEKIDVTLGMRFFLKQHRRKLR